MRVGGALRESSRRVMISRAPASQSVHHASPPDSHWKPSVASQTKLQRSCKTLVSLQASKHHRSFLPNLGLVSSPFACACVLGRSCVHLILKSFSLVRNRHIAHRQRPRMIPSRPCSTSHLLWPSTFDQSPILRTFQHQEPSQCQPTTPQSRHASSPPPLPDTPHTRTSTLRPSCVKHILSVSQPISQSAKPTAKAIAPSVPSVKTDTLRPQSRFQEAQHTAH